MRIVIGLGNIGKRYELTRHNVGFLLLDSFATQNKLVFNSSSKNYLSTKGESSDSPFLLAKPTTYMNLSGIAISEIIEKYSITLDNVLILHDDFDLELGKIKIKQSGSGGGHNGVGSIIEHLASDKFTRLRIGIGKAFAEGEMADYVLDKFSIDDFTVLKNSFVFGCDLIERFIGGGVKAMLDFYSASIGSKPIEGN